MSNSRLASECSFLVIDLLTTFVNFAFLAQALEWMLILRRKVFTAAR